MRTCRECLTEKPVSDYNKRNRTRTRDGISFLFSFIPTICKTCENAHRTAFSRTASGQASSRRTYEQRKQTGKHQEYRTSDSWKESKTKYLQSDKSSARLKRARSRRTERIDASGDTLTAYQWRRILRAYDGYCAYCDQNDRPLTIDHVIPVARGGSNTKTNVVPSCHSCNSRKRDELGWVPKAPRKPLTF